MTGNWKGIRRGIDSPQANQFNCILKKYFEPYSTPTLRWLYTQERKNVKSRIFTVAEVNGLMSLFGNDIFQFDDWKCEAFTLLNSFAASESI